MPETLEEFRNKTRKKYNKEVKTQDKKNVFSDIEAEEIVDPPQITLPVGKYEIKYTELRFPIVQRILRYQDTAKLLIAQKFQELIDIKSEGDIEKIRHFEKEFNILLDVMKNGEKFLEFIDKTIIEMIALELNITEKLVEKEFSKRPEHFVMIKNYIDNDKGIQVALQGRNDTETQKKISEILKALK